MTLSRREFIQAAAAMGASLAWAGTARASRRTWRERRDLYPEGVASGDPDPNSVILWTRRPFDDGERAPADGRGGRGRGFPSRRRAGACAGVRRRRLDGRVLVGGLKPARVYWYRFTDAEGNGSRVGRTITAPPPNDPRPINFAFVSCQSVNEGKLNAYRRMIFEDERAAARDQLGFVLHLGDFIYEVVEYPDEVKTRYDRTIYEVARIPDGGKFGNFHYPADPRRLSRRLSRLSRRSRPAGCPGPLAVRGHVGQSRILLAGLAEHPEGRRSAERPGQTIKVAANQAWFEYHARAREGAERQSLETFGPPPVKDVPIEKWDENGLGDEPNNLAAINSLIGYRALRYGKHLDLIITDQHSYRSADPFSDNSLDKLGDWADFNGMFPEDAAADPRRRTRLQWRQSAGGARVRRVRTSRTRKRMRRRRRSSAPSRKRGSRTSCELATATWKIWGNSQARSTCAPTRRTFRRVSPRPGRPASPMLGGGDHGTAWIERGEIYDLVRDARITGFAIVSGDRHSFWAGYAQRSSRRASSSRSA